MTAQTFTLRSEFIELHTLLKLLTLASSGGEAKFFVAEGLVTVDGEVETRKTRKVYAGSIVRFGEHEISVLA